MLRGDGEVATTCIPTNVAESTAIKHFHSDILTILLNLLHGRNEKEAALLQITS